MSHEVRCILLLVPFPARPVESVMSHEVLRGILLLVPYEVRRVLLLVPFPPPFVDPRIAQKMLRFPR